MKVAPFESRLDVPVELASLVGAGLNGRRRERVALRHYAGAVADSLHQYNVVLVKIGALRLDRDRSYALARQIVAQLRKEIVRRGAPRELRAEFDPPDETLVAPDQITRNRLPHADGQSVTFLTPSRVDAPMFDARLRTFSATGGHTSRSHKPYAGIVVEDPGEALSITTFYDLFQLAHEAYVHQRNDACPSVADLAAWMGANIAAAHRRRAKYGFHYISLAGMLSDAVDPAFEVVEYGAAEQPIPDRVINRFPILDRMRRGCPCGRCTGETERVFCAMVCALLGSDWSSVRDRLETWLSSERFDLILWNNVAVLHGAVMGSRHRTLRGVYLSMREAAGDAYEAWLSELWHARLGHLVPAVAVGA